MYAENDQFAEQLFGEDDKKNEHLASTGITITPPKLLTLPNAPSPISVNRAEDKEANDAEVIAENSNMTIFTDSLVNGLTLCGINCAVNINIFVSGTIVKAVSEETLAAYSLVYSETAALVIIFIAPLTAINVIVSHNKKQGVAPDEIAKTIQAGWIFAAMLTLPSLIIASVNKPLLLGLQQEEKVTEIVQAYFWVSLPAWLPLYLQFASGQFLSGLKKRLLPLAIDAGVLALSIFLTETFSLGKFGADALDIKGYAISFAVSSWINMLGYQVLLYLHKDFKQYQLYKIRPGLSKELLKLVKMGMPIMLAYLGEAGIILSSALMAGKLGQQQLITQSVFGLYLVLLTIPNISLFESTSVLVSGAIGAKRTKDIRRYILTNIGLSLVCPLSALILTCAIPKQFMKPFIDPDSIFNKNIVDNLYISLPLLAAGNIFDSIRLVLSGSLLGMQDIEITSLVNALLQMCVTIPLMYALSFHTSLDVNGLMTAYLIGSFILTIYTSLRSYSVSEKLLNPKIAMVANNLGENLLPDPSQSIEEAHEQEPSPEDYVPPSEKGSVSAAQPEENDNNTPPSLPLAPGSPLSEDEIEHFTSARKNGSSTLIFNSKSKPGTPANHNKNLASNSDQFESLYQLQ